MNRRPWPWPLDLLAAAALGALQTLAFVHTALWWLPLLLLSADRPPELQQCGANQTIDQQHLFAGQLRAFHAPGAPFAF